MASLTTTVRGAGTIQPWTGSTFLAEVLDLPRACLLQSETFAKVCKASKVEDSQHFCFEWPCPSRKISRGLRRNGKASAKGDSHPLMARNATRPNGNLPTIDALHALGMAGWGHWQGKTQPLLSRNRIFLRR